jgi:hypothetical protein
VWVEGGIADAIMDKGIEWELIDWDNIRSGATVWTHEDIARLAKWGKGLVSKECIADLRAAADEELQYAEETNDDN